MAGPSTRLVILLTLIQVNLLFSVDGLTLPLQAITTKCEALPKNPLTLNQEAICEKRTLDNSKTPADLVSTATCTIPSVTSPNLNNPMGNCPLINLENKCSASPNDPFCLPRISSETANPAVSFPAPLPESNPTLGPNVCQSNPSFVPTNLGSTLPSQVSCSATSVTSPALPVTPTRCDEGQIGISNSASTILGPNKLLDLIRPLDPFANSKMNCNPPSLGFKMPLIVSSSTSSLDPNRKAVFSTQSVAPVSDVCSRPSSQRPNFETNSFLPPQITPTVLVKPELPLIVSSYNNFPTSSGIMPLSATPSSCILEPVINSKSPLYSALQKTIIPDYTSFDLLNRQNFTPLDPNCETTPSSLSTSVNIAEYPDIKQEMLAAVPSVSSGLESTLPTPNSASNLGNPNLQFNSPLRDYINRVFQPQPFINNICSVVPKYMPNMLLSTAQQNESPDSTKLSPNILSNSGIYPLCSNQNLDSSLDPSASDASSTMPTASNTAAPYVSPSSSIPLSSCSVTSGSPILDNVFLSPNQCETSSLPVTQFNSNNFEALLCNDQAIQSPLSPDYVATGFPVMPTLYGGNVASNLQTFPQPNVYSSLTCPDSYVLPDSPTLPMTNNLPSNSFEIPSFSNQNRPIGKYFKDMRAATSKLNDFISSFSSRIGSGTFAYPSFANILSSPKTLLIPNIVSIVQEVAPETPNSNTTISLIPACSPTDPLTPNQVTNTAAGVPVTNNDPIVTMQAPEDILTTETSTVCDDLPITLATPLENNVSIVAPKIPQTILNRCNFPICSTPIQYDNFKDSIASLSYNNFLPYSFAGLSSGPVSPNPYFSSFISAPFLSKTYDKPSERPYSQAKSFTSLPSIVPPVSSCSTSSDPIASNDIESLASLLMSNTFSAVETPNVSSKKPFPYYSSITGNTTPTCEDPETDSSADIPGFSSSSPTSPITSLDESQLDMCCKDLERMIATLELSLILDGEANCDFDSLNSILSFL